MLALLASPNRQALLVALAVFLGIALLAGAMVVAKTVRGQGNAADRLVGTNGPDRLDGHAGPDLLLGRGGRDVLRGGRGPDTIKGGPGPDLIQGQLGADITIGGAGNDTIRGGRGRDLINITADGREVGGAGNDVIRARDGSLDEISCGAGRDKAIVDRAEDGVFDCETVVEPR
jgi:Ca2+-binding RTX toxin-like protein